MSLGALIMKTKIIAGLYIIILLAIIFIADHQTYHQIFEVIRAVPFGDKIGHFALIGMLAVVVNVLFAYKKIRLRGLQIFRGSLVVMLFVTLEEISQLFIRYRTFELGDLTADYLGIFLFTRLATYLNQRSTRKIEKPS